VVAVAVAASVAVAVAAEKGLQQLDDLGNALVQRERQAFAGVNGML
jgi:hypothetical protein